MLFALSVQKAGGSGGLGGQVLGGKELFPTKAFLVVRLIRRQWPLWA